jgi:hypothetical protein
MLIIVAGDLLMKDSSLGSRRVDSRWMIAVPVAALIVAVSVAASAAGPDPPPEAVTADAMDWWSVDGGGGRASGGNWAVVSAIGQFDAGTLSAGAYVLNGGFVAADEPVEPPLFADGFESGDHGAWSSATP